MNIGLVAHDSKKELMVNFCIAYKNILAAHELYATGTTGQLVEDIVELDVNKFLPGHLGGSRQMADHSECNEIDAMIFLRDPIRPADHEPDSNQIIRLCDQNNIPAATNLATAEILVMAIARGDLDWRNSYK